jgi:hypothetical protein
MDGSREREERHQRIRTALAVARTVLGIVWLMVDLRHLF